MTGILLQFDRLYTLGHTKTLLDQLSHLPSLEDAKKMIQNAVIAAEDSEPRNLAVDTGTRRSPRGPAAADWFNDLAVPEIERAAASHISALSTIRGANKNKWSIVPSPSSVLDQPVDICALESKKSQKHTKTRSAFLSKLMTERNNMASGWLSGKLRYISVV